MGDKPEAPATPYHPFGYPPWQCHPTWRPTGDVLVVLDNATDEAQVRPLLPGSPECAVLVTSRSRMAALAGAAAVPLDLLPPGQAIGLFTAIIGEARAQAEPAAVAEIARLCGYLPIALRIAGARLVSRLAWTISWFAGRLRDESRRLDLLKAGDLEVRASFALSYQSRDETEKRAFRMLGCSRRLPGLEPRRPDRTDGDSRGLPQPR